MSIVIPAYNSADYVGENVARVVEYFYRTGLDGEVIVADDGSTDGTADSVVSGPQVTVLRLPHRGKGGALRAGMATATGETRGFTDADLPYGIEPLALALRYVQGRGYHVVIGDRTLPGSTYQSSGLVRSTMSQVASFAFRTMVTGGIYDTQCGFKLFRGDVAEELFRVARIDGFAIDVELIYLALKYRLDIKRLPVRLERNAPSSVHVLRDSLHTVRDIATIRVNWARGRYRSPALARALEDELARDVAESASYLTAADPAHRLP